MRQELQNFMVAIIATLISAGITLLSGCISSKINYSNIPLATGDEPYILAPGDYMDNKGNLHLAQTNVWVMTQKDVYEYVRWLRDHE